MFHVKHHVLIKLTIYVSYANCITVVYRSNLWCLDGNSIDWNLISCYISQQNTKYNVSRET